MKKIILFLFTILNITVFSQSTNLNGWMKNGNQLLNNTSFFGSIDNRSLIFKTNNNQVFKLDSLGFGKFSNLLTVPSLSCLGAVNTNTVLLKPNGSNSPYMEFQTAPGIVFAPISSTYGVQLFSGTQGAFSWYSKTPAGYFYTRLSTASNTSNLVITMPLNNGQLALTSDLTAYTPTITGGYIPYQSASSFTTPNSITSPSFITNGGTSSQFVKGNGTLDNTVYLTSANTGTTYLPINNPTFTGLLTGTNISVTSETVTGLTTLNTLTATGSPTISADIVLNGGNRTINGSNTLIMNAGTGASVAFQNGGTNMAIFNSTSETLTGDLNFTGGNRNIYNSNNININAANVGSVTIQQNSTTVVSVSSNSVAITGTVSISGNLNVTGASALSTLRTTGNTSVTGTFSAGGQSSLSTMSVSSTSTLSGDVTFNGGNRQITGSNNVTINSGSAGNVILNAGASTNAQIAHNGTVIVQTSSTGVAFTGTASISNSLTANGITNNGNETVAGTSSITGNVSLPHIIGTKSVASNTLGAAAGTGPTATLTGCTDLGGTIQLTTGTATSTGTLITVTFGTAYTGANKPIIILSPNNAASAALGTTSQVWGDANNTTFFINAGTVGLSASTLYKWNYTITQGQ